MDQVMTLWYDMHQDLPVYGQIVEVLVKKPAMYRGTNEQGYQEWFYYDLYQENVAWRLPTDPEFYKKVVRQIKSSK